MTPMDKEFFDSMDRAARYALWVIAGALAVMVGLVAWMTYSYLR